MRDLPRRHPLLTAALWVGMAGVASAQSLDQLVEEGLRANRSLAIGQAAVDRAAASLREAKGFRYPALGFEARYTARSGATTDIGRLINPAFGALNQLLGSQRFPTDVSLALPLRQQTGVRLTQTLFAPAIGAGIAAARAGQVAEEARLAGSARQVAAAIQTGYLDYLRAQRTAELYDSTESLLAENVRVNERLLAAGSNTPDHVLRARAERETVVQKQLEAAQIVTAARRRVNLLVGRPIDAPLAVMADSLLGLGLTLSVDEAVARALAGREDLAELDAGVAVARAQRRAASATALPTVSAALDYGFQGDRYRFGSQHDFALASVVVQWNWVNGGRDRARRLDADLAIRQLELARLDAKEQIELEVRTAYDAARTAQQAIATANTRTVAARRTHDLVARRFAAGAATALEYLDARVSRTDAELNLIVTQYQFYQRCADLDRAGTLRAWTSLHGGA